MKLRYAIVGCGAAGKVHAYHLSRDPRVECVAAADPHRPHADYFCEHFGFRRAYRDLDELLQHDQVEILSIASPPAAHLRQLERALQAGIPVLCEKPLVISSEEIAELQHLLDRYHSTVSVMLPRRFYNNSRAAKRALDAGALGAIKRVSLNLRCSKPDAYYATWRGRKAVAGGGVLLSQSIHSIDQLVYFFGKPVEVDGHVQTLRPGLEVEDEAEGTVLFESGVKAHIRASCNATDCVWRAITTVVGSHGRIELDSADTTCWEVPGIPAPVAEEPEIVPELYKPIYYGPGHFKVVQDFLAAVTTASPAASPAAVAIPAMSAVLAFYRSSMLGARQFVEHGITA